MRFDALNAFDLISVKVFADIASASNSGDILIELVDNTGAVIEDSLINFGGTVSDSVIGLGWSIPAGTDYILRKAGGGAEIYRNSLRSLIHMIFLVCSLLEKVLATGFYYYF